MRASRLQRPRQSQGEWTVVLTRLPVQGRLTGRRGEQDRIVDHRAVRSHQRQTAQDRALAGDRAVATGVQDHEHPAGLDLVELVQDVLGRQRFTLALKEVRARCEQGRRL